MLWLFFCSCDIKCIISLQIIFTVYQKTINLFWLVCGNRAIKSPCLVSIAFSDWVDNFNQHISTQSEKAIETRQGDVISLFPQSIENKCIVFCLTINIISSELHMFWLVCGNRTITSPCLVSIAFSDWVDNFNQHMQHTYWSEKLIETRQDALIVFLLMWY